MTQTQDRAIQAEADQTHDQTPTGPESSMKLHNSLIKDIGTIVIDNQAITEWISQDFRADHMEFLASQSFPASFGQLEAKDTYDREDLWSSLNIHESSSNNTNNSRPVLAWHNSSSSLHSFLDFTMTSDTYDAPGSWTNPNPTTSDALSLVHDGPQPACNLDHQRPLMDRTKTATWSRSNGIPSTMALTKRGKTVLKLENLDPETRGDVLDLLCRRKIITKIEIV